MSLYNLFLTENGMSWTTHLRLQSSIVANSCTRITWWIYDEKAFSGNH